MRLRWSNTGASPIGPSPGSSVRAFDAMPPRRRPGRDQAQPVLLCRLGQHGETGEWSAEDPDGNPLTVKNGTGGLEIFTPGEAEGDQGGGENLAGGGPPGAANLDALRRKIGPRAAFDRPTSTQQADQMRSMQQYLDELHRPRS